jgi:hypothetical protein
MFEPPQYNRKRFFFETITRAKVFCLKGFEYFPQGIRRASRAAGGFCKFRRG